MAKYLDYVIFIYWLKISKRNTSKLQTKKISKKLSKLYTKFFLFLQILAIQFNYMHYWVPCEFDLDTSKYYAVLVGSYAWELQNKYTRWLNNYREQAMGRAVQNCQSR